MLHNKLSHCSSGLSAVPFLGWALSSSRVSSVQAGWWMHQARAAPCLLGCSRAQQIPGSPNSGNVEAHPMWDEVQSHMQKWYHTEPWLIRESFLKILNSMSMRKDFESPRGHPLIFQINILCYALFWKFYARTEYFTFTDEISTLLWHLALLNILFGASFPSVTCGCNSLLLLPVLLSLSCLLLQTVTEGIIAFHNPCWSAHAQCLRIGALETEFLKILLGCVYPSPTWVPTWKGDQASERGADLTSEDTGWKCSSVNQRGLRTKQMWWHL